MANEGENSSAREQVLSVAEALFSERGYTAVTLKDIADKLGVKQAALYYHVPQGKEQLFVEVITRNYNRHRHGLEQSIAQSEPAISPQLKAMAMWLLSQPPLDFSRMARSDLPALSEKHAQTLYQLGQVSLAQPVQQVLTQAYERGEIRLTDTKVMATVFLSVVDTMHDLHQYTKIAKEVLVQDVLDIWLNGLRR